MMRQLVSSFACLLLVLAGGIVAQEPLVEKDAIDVTAIRPLPVLHRQRFKPLDTLAMELVRAVTGKAKYRGVDPVATYLHWRFSPEVARSQPFIKMPAARIAKLIGAEGVGASHTNASYDSLRDNGILREMLADVRSKDPETWGEQDRSLISLSNRIQAFGEISGLNDGWEKLPEGFRGLLPIIPKRGGMVEGEVYKWLQAGEIVASGYAPETIKDFAAAHARLREAWLDDDGAGFTAASKDLIAVQATMEYPTQFRGMGAMDREVRLNHAHPFQWAKWTYVLAAFLALLSLLTSNRIVQWLPLPFIVGAMAVHGWGLWERTWLSERAMIGTFYESMLFVAFASPLIAFAFELWFRRKWFFLAGGLLGWLCLVVALNNPDFMNPEISKLRPVLINNYWIHIHVPTIMMSYAALGLAVILAHVYLIRNLWTSARRPGMKELANFLYWTIPVGTILLFVGMVLGGIWADASWGRFWGWDPKETWSFITWLVFLVIIHGRWSGWLRDYGTAFGTMLGGWALLWTYYGANFFQSGLHSYAAADASAEIPTWLMIFSGFEILLLGASAIVHLNRGDAGPKNQGKKEAESRPSRAAEHPEPAGSPT